MYDAKVRGAVPQVGERVLVKNVGIRGKHKLADKWENDVYVIVDQPDPTLPVYSIRKEGTRTKTRTVHRNMLLPLSLPGIRRKPTTGKGITTPVHQSSSSAEPEVLFAIPRNTLSTPGETSGSSSSSCW